MLSRNEVVVNLDTVKANLFDYYCDQLVGVEPKSEKLFYAANNMLVASGVIDLIEGLVKEKSKEKEEYEQALDTLCYLIAYQDALNDGKLDGNKILNDDELDALKIVCDAMKAR